MSEENPRQNVTFESAGRTAHGYLATPEQGSGPGVIVIQEWWGLDDHIVDVCDRLATAGFTALAPDLYGGKVVHEADDAEKEMMSLPVDQAASDLGGAVDYLIGHDATSSSTVGTMGFCMGGGFVLLLANQQGDKISAALPFYGVGPAVPEGYTGITADVQGHYGESDDFYPVDDAKKQEQQIAEESSGEVEFFYYPAGHAFLNDRDKIGTYDPEQAKIAWDRSLEFLKSKVS